MPVQNLLNERMGVTPVMNMIGSKTGYTRKPPGLPAGIDGGDAHNAE